MTKVLILAGGKGTRFSEKTIKKPKPLIEIGKNSLIWHIMNQYSNFNLTRDQYSSVGKVFTWQLKGWQFDSAYGHHVYFIFFIKIKIIDKTTATKTS